MIIYNNPDVHELIAEFDRMLKFLDENLSFNNIKVSKVGKWSRLLKDDIEIAQKIPYLWQVNRFVRALKIIEEHSENIDKVTIENILKGAHDNFSGKPESFLFELDIASRLINSNLFKQKKFSINLKERADIIVNNEIFIECKKISSKKTFENNIRDVNNQLKGLKKGEFGIIVLDITSLIQERYIKLIEKESDLSNIDISEISKQKLKNWDETLGRLITEEYYNICKKMGRVGNFEIGDRIIGLTCQVDVLVPLKESFVSIRNMKYETFYSNKWISKFFKSIFMP